MDETFSRKSKICVLDQFWVRIFAIITMTCDHLGLMLLGYVGSVPMFWTLGPILRCIGGIAFPLFTLFLAEGLYHTRNWIKYLSKIGLMWVGLTAATALIKQVSGTDFGANPFTDLIMIGLFLGLAFKAKGWWKILAILPFGYVALSYGVYIYESLHYVNIVWFPDLLRAGYSLWGLLLTLGYFLARKLGNFLMAKRFAVDETPHTEEDKRIETQYFVNILSILALVLVTLVFWGIAYLNDGAYDVLRMRIHDDLPYMCRTYCVLAAPFILLYNGKRGYDSKAFRVASYSYFPAHLVIIFLILLVIFGY